MNSVQELDEHIPHCILCGKKLRFLLSGIANFLPNGRENIKKSLQLYDDFLVSKKEEFVINSYTNEIVAGQEILSKIPIIEIKKYCATCNFSISSYEEFGVESIRHGSHSKLFNKLLIRNYYLAFTLSRGKNVEIFGNPPEWKLQATSSVYINYKYVSGAQFRQLDIAQFKNLKQLSKRISTLLTFS